MPTGHRCISLSGIYSWTFAYRKKGIEMLFSMDYLPAKLKVRSTIYNSTPTETLNLNFSSLGGGRHPHYTESFYFSDLLGDQPVWIKRIPSRTDAQHQSVPNSRVQPNEQHKMWARMIKGQNTESREAHSALLHFTWLKYQAKKGKKNII